MGVCVYVYVCICIYMRENVCLFVCMYVYIFMYVSTVCMYACMFVCMYVCMYIYTYIHIYECFRSYIYIHATIQRRTHVHTIIIIILHTYIHTYIYIYIYTYILTTDQHLKHAHENILVCRYTDTQKDRQTETYRHRLRESFWDINATSQASDKFMPAQWRQFSLSTCSSGLKSLGFPKQRENNLDYTS
jgi:hypothetical protein